MNGFRYGLASILWFCSVFSSLCSQSTPPFFTPHPDPPVKVPAGQTYQFGYLTVPENRSEPTGKTIQLPVYIFKSRSEHPQPDPVIYTVGGPGSTTLPAAAYMNYYRYLDDRDLILFEQRGTYYARPHLGCEAWAQAVFLTQFPEVSPAEADSLLARAAKACKEQFLKLEIDLNAYHTREIAADIADLKTALGIDRYNLLTISYSTKIAQVLMRDHPEGIRSVVMDSPLPLEVNYDLESVGNLLATFNRILTDCEKDPACQKAFPNLKQRFWAFLEARTEDPLLLTVEDPTSRDSLTFFLRGKDLIGLLGTDYTGNVPAVPLQINQVLTGDLTLLREKLAAMLTSPDNGAGMGMRLSVWCAEELPFVDRDRLRQEKEKYAAVRGLSPAVFEPKICDIWGVQPMGEKENEPVKSDIPVLLINGEYDPNTPPRWAAQMQKNLSRSFHLVFPGWLHTPTTYWNNPCAMEVARRFFLDPTQKPDPDCFRNLEAPSFQGNP